MIISQLKAELFELRKSQRNYDTIFSKVRHLENHYYDLLEELVNFALFFFDSNECINKSHRIWLNRMLIRNLWRDKERLDI